MGACVQLSQTTFGPLCDARCRRRRRDKIRLELVFYGFAPEKICQMSVRYTSKWAVL